MERRLQERDEEIVLKDAKIGRLEKKNLRHVMAHIVTGAALAAAIALLIIRR
jgi:hypothetical protein